MEEFEGRVFVPETEPERRRLERWADSILAEAHLRKTSDGRMRDNNGRRVMSLDDEYGLEVSALWLSTNLDKVERLMVDLADTTSLTRAERDVCQAIAEGSALPPARGWTDSVAEMLRKTPNAVWSAWHKAKKKLIDEWANEPEERTTKVILKSAREGTGHNLIIGRERPDRAPRVGLADKIVAWVGHLETKSLDRDWGYEPSLTDDGWQLHDDHFWS